MTDKRRYDVYPSNLSIPDAFDKLRDYLEKTRLVEKPHGCKHIIYSLEPEPGRTLACGGFGEFLELLKAYPHARPIHAHSHWTLGEAEDLGWQISVWPSHLDVTVESPTDFNLVSAVHAKIQDIFRAKNPLAVESRPNRYNTKKSVFLAHRFDDYGREMSGLLRRFLERLGFDVVEGEGYEARDIPDKIIERISTQDIFICVVTPGDTSWLLSETAYAKGRTKYVIIICEDKVLFTGGIIGADYEYMTFPKGAIEKVFSDLIVALPR
jgi:hypothetical protein